MSPFIFSVGLVEVVGPGLIVLAAGNRFKENKRNEEMELGLAGLALGCCNKMKGRKRYRRAGRLGAAFGLAE